MRKITAPARSASGQMAKTYRSVVAAARLHPTGFAVPSAVIAVAVALVTFVMAVVVRVIPPGLFGMGSPPMFPPGASQPRHRPHPQPVPTGPPNIQLTDASQGRGLAADAGPCPAGGNGTGSAGGGGTGSPPTTLPTPPAPPVGSSPAPPPRQNPAPGSPAGTQTVVPVMVHASGTVIQASQTVTGVVGTVGRTVQGVTGTIGAVTGAVRVVTITVGEVPGTVNTVLGTVDALTGTARSEATTKAVGAVAGTASAATGTVGAVTIHRTPRRTTPPGVSRPRTRNSSASRRKIASRLAVGAFGRLGSFRDGRAL